jgi:hypothetical protein
VPISRKRQTGGTGRGRGSGMLRRCVPGRDADRCPVQASRHHAARTGRIQVRWNESPARPPARALAEGLPDHLAMGPAAERHARSEPLDDAMGHGARTRHQSEPRRVLLRLPSCLANLPVRRYLTLDRAGRRPTPGSSFYFSLKEHAAGPNMVCLVADGCTPYVFAALPYRFSDYPDY